MLVERDEVTEVLSRFLKGDKKTKSALFDEIIGLMTSLLSQLKTALVKGTKQEKKTLLKKLKLLRYVMQAHFESVKAKTNVTQEGLQLLMSDFFAAFPNYRNKISNAKQELEVHKSDLMKLTQPVGRKKMNPMRVKSKWLRS